MKPVKNKTRSPEEGTGQYGGQALNTTGIYPFIMRPQDQCTREIWLDEEFRVAPRNSAVYRYSQLRRLDDI